MFKTSNLIDASFKTAKGTESQLIFYVEPERRNRLFRTVAASDFGIILERFPQYISNISANFCSEI